MTIRLVANEDPRWTSYAIDHLEEFQDEVGATTTEWIAHVRQEITAGTPSSRKPDRPGAELFEIFVGDQHVGDVVVIPCWGTHEIDIAVWKPFQGKGYGTLALREIVAMTVPSRFPIVQATIRQSNRNKRRVRSQLISQGFQCIHPSDDDLEIWEYPSQEV